MATRWCGGTVVVFASRHACSMVWCETATWGGAGEIESRTHFEPRSLASLGEAGWCEFAGFAPLSYLLSTIAEPAAVVLSLAALGRRPPPFSKVNWLLRVMSARQGRARGASEAVQPSWMDCGKFAVRWYVMAGGGNSGGGSGGGGESSTQRPHGRWPYLHETPSPCPSSQTHRPRKTPPRAAFASIIHSWYYYSLRVRGLTDSSLLLRGACSALDAAVRGHVCRVARPASNHDARTPTTPAPLVLHSWKSS